VYIQVYGIGSHLISGDYMAFQLKDRVKETTTTTGTGTISLDGAATGFQSFVSSIGDGNVTYYAIEDGNGAAWEVGVGTITDGSPDTLSRDTVLSSSSGGSKISLSALSHTVYATYPAGKAVYIDTLGNLSHRKSPFTNAGSDKSLDTDDEIVFCNASSGIMTVTLYAATGNGGRRVVIKKTDSTAYRVNIIRTGSETIDGETSISLKYSNESVTLVSDNSNWFII